jgi:hypothetical protein
MISAALERFSRIHARKPSRFCHHQRRDRERFAETARIDLSYSASDFAFSLCRVFPYARSSRRDQ